MTKLGAPLVTDLSLNWANYNGSLTTAVAWNFEPFVLAQFYSYRVETQTESCALTYSILL